MGRSELSDGNYLYRHPEFYELIYPDPDEENPRMCQMMFSRYLPKLPGSILDMGCGTGRDIDALSRTCSKCWGIDIVRQNIQYASKIRPHLHLKIGDMRTVRLGRTFDVVTCMGSTLMYALTDRDVEQVLETFRAHSHPGTLLILDLLNASSIVDGDKFIERSEKNVDLPGLSGRVITFHSLDHDRQILSRRRTWNCVGGDPIEDFCEYRLFFPAELEELLSRSGFNVEGMFDNVELEKSSLSGTRLYVGATRE
jgi:SAM-dependent methyltransferase